MGGKDTCGKGGVMIISRVWAMPNKFTFKIRPIAELLKRYSVGKNWADPFAGSSELTEYRNDIEHSRKCSLDGWIDELPENLAGGLVDPPYSPRQIAEHYKKVGRKVTTEDTQNQYAKIYNKLCPKIKPGGLIISFGWHSNGAGKGRGFELIEVLLVAHGGAHNDTICTVERKLKTIPLSSCKQTVISFEKS